MCPTGSWENGVVRYRAGLRAFGAGKRPPCMSTSLSPSFNHSHPSPVRADQTSSRPPRRLRAYEVHHNQVTLCPRQPTALTTHPMHTANRSPTTRYPPALRTRTAQLTPSCARHLAGSGVDGFFARCVPHRCSSRAPCSGGAEVARGVVAGSFGVCECHVAHPRVAPCCRLPSWSPGADLSTRMWRRRRASGPPCLGGAGAAPMVAASLFWWRVWHVAWALSCKKSGRSHGRVAVSCRARAPRSIG